MHTTSSTPFSPLYGPDRTPRSLFDWASLLLADILLKPGTNGIALYDRIHTNARARAGMNPEPLDPLLEALGWSHDDLPDLSCQTFASAMGSLFERLLHALYAHTRPALYSADWKALAKEAGIDDTTAGQGKRWADFLVGDTAIEVKYRYGSGQSSDDQGRCASRLQAIGKTPVMLALRPSPKSATMASQGWQVYEGAAAIAYIEKNTGINLSELAQACLHHPLFAQQRAPRMQAWHAQRSAEAEAAILALPLATQQMLLNRLSDCIAA